MDSILDFFNTFLLHQGISMKVSAWIIAFCILAVGYGIFALLYYVVGPTIEKLASKTPTKIDDILFRRAVRVWIWWFVVGLFLDHYLTACFEDPYPEISRWINTVMDVVIIGFATKAAVEMLKGVFLIIFDKEKVEETASLLRQSAEDDIEFEYKPSHSLQGLQQMLVIVIIAIGLILMGSVLFGKNPIYIVSGLGAGAAVLSLIFKDSILGVVAGIQLTVNDMLRPGDWIIASKYGANGRVQEVTLATVKVLNWDHTIVTIPPYNLISDSFQNWRKMEDSGGRRVARSFNIDMTTVRFVTEEEIERFSQQEWAKGIDWTDRPVNLSVFRKYLEHYIKTRPTFQPNMLYMIRELAPTPEGLPIELYFFTSETSWARYELVQAATLDHVLAVITDFGLKLFQSPTGADIKKAIQIKGRESQPVSM